MPELIWGRNPILETLHSKRRVKRILLAEGQRAAPVINTIVQEAEQRRIPVEVVPRSRLDQMSRGAIHQGCIAQVEERHYASTDQILAYAAEKDGGAERMAG